MHARTTHPVRRFVTRVLALAATGLFAGAAAATTAHALPPDGAGSSTPGTSSTVTSTLAPGGTLRFTLRGFPAGETVSVKIDDGNGFGDQTIQGAGVVYQQKIAKDGSVSGSFALPSSVAAGSHWLRFLASQEFTDAQGNVGVNGFTNRSPSFTVKAAASSSGAEKSTGSGSGSGSAATSGSAKKSGSVDTGSSGASTAGTSGTTADDGTTGSADPSPAATSGSSAAPTAGGVVTARPADDTTASPSPTSEATTTVEAAAGTPPTVAVAAASGDDPDGGLPVVGLTAVGVAIVVAGAAAYLLLRRKPAPAGAGASAEAPGAEPAPDPR